MPVFILHSRSVRWNDAFHTPVQPTATIIPFSFLLISKKGALSPAVMFRVSPAHILVGTGLKSSSDACGALASKTCSVSGSQSAGDYAA